GQAPPQFELVSTPRPSRRGPGNRVPPTSSTPSTTASPPPELCSGSVNATGPFPQAVEICVAPISTLSGPLPRPIGPQSSKPPTTTSAAAAIRIVLARFERPLTRLSIEPGSGMATRLPDNGDKAP